MLIARSDKLISIVTKLAEDVQILKSKKGVLVAVTSPFVATHPISARVPVDVTPPVGSTPPVTATHSSTNISNMPTNDGYWYNSHEGGGIPNDGNYGHKHSSLANEDNSIPMEMDEVVGIVGEPSDVGVAIKALVEGKYKGMGK